MAATKTSGSTIERTFNRMAVTFPAEATTERYRASGVYDKVALLVVMALATAAFGYLLASPGVVLVAVLVGFVLAMVGTFRPRTAKVVAPLYALVEGVALGGVSAFYASLGGGIVPLAVVFTGAVFLAALGLYRTGLVKVTPRFIAMTMMATAGLAVVYLAALLGLRLPGIDDLGPGGLIFGVIGLAVGVFNLFIDFAYVERAEVAGVSAEAEWYGALAMMLSLVLVYISVLRIVASSGGGRRR